MGGLHSSASRLSTLLLCVWTPLGLAACSASTRSPNVVLIVVDTVRADRLSCYGYERPTTPRIDELCARGLRFENAVSTSSWTLPAHASLFTGEFPIRHGATQEHARLEDGAATLAELLDARGYATLAASANPIVSVRSGLARGFEEFEETWRASGARPHPNLVATRRLLTSLESGRPFFLFVNYLEAHAPYAPPEPHRSRFLRAGLEPALVASAQRRSTPEYYLRPGSIDAREITALSDLYDGEIARVDELVGELVGFLDAGGHLDDTLLVLTSDHGENLGEHGHFRHVFSLYRSTVRVPLVLLLPGGERAGEVRRDPAALVDVFSTILALCGVAPPPGQGAGRDLLAAGDGAADRPLFAEYYFPFQVLDLFGSDARGHRDALRPHLRRLRSVEHAGLRLIWSSDGRHELYELGVDPTEAHDVADAAQLAERASRLRSLLDDYVERGGGPKPLPDAARGAALGEFDPESRARLRELGYLR